MDFDHKIGVSTHVYSMVLKESDDEPDGQLVGRFVAGDGSAYEALVTRHARFAGAVAYGVTGDFHASRDVVQESFLKVYTGLSSLKEPDKFKSWLRNIVRTTALDWRRRNKRGVQSLDAFEADEVDYPAAPESQSTQVDQVADKDELKRRVREEIEKLPESHREVVALKYLDGRSYEEIATLTGLSRNTIESRLFRARQKLKARFERVLGPAVPSAVPPREIKL